MAARLELEDGLRQAVKVERHRSLLPASRRSHERRALRLRGAEPLAASGSRPDPARRLRPHRREHRPDRRHDHVGAAEGLPQGTRLPAAYHDRDQRQPRARSRTSASPRRSWPC
ncbi:MAG: hypothetical protein WDN31_00925 [Hyphomicrobium sp.]